MKEKHFLKRILAATLVSGMVVTSVQPAAAAVSRFPDVTKGMTEASFWYNRAKDADKVLATENQIKKLNKAIIAAEGTNVVDLKKVSTTVDGKEMNDLLYKAAKADTEYFGDSKYDAAGIQAGASYYSTMVSNTQSTDTTVHPVSYGITVNRTAIRVLPTDKAILDDPGDNDFDNLYVTGLRVNDPVIIKSTSHDKKYYYVTADCYSGWIPVEDIAVCADRDEWLDAWDHDSSELLVVYGSKLRTEDSYTTPETANRLLTQGTTLEIVPKSDYPDLISNRSPYNNYVVYMPIREADGSYKKQPALISQSADAREGFLPLTQENIMKVSFEMLGDTYGWGGMLSSNDCSGYVRDVYRCFGLNLPRNTTWQSASPVKKYTLTGLSAGAKCEIIKNLPIGSTLFFPGHEMTYLGHKGDNYYVISSTSSMMNPKKDGEKLRVRSIIINTLDIKRANGNTWLESLSAATIPFAGTANSLYKKDFVGSGFSKALDKTAIKKATAGSKKITVKWTAAAEDSAITGYQIQYTAGDDFSAAQKLTVKNKAKTSATITKLTKGTTYKLRLRNYVTIDGKKYFSKWSKIKSCNVK